ncbi:MAG: orotate phosphoribosyltransferase [Candidatus Micrarchaeota archaeon]
MQSPQSAEKFARFLLERKALKVAANEAGFFTLKSGRKSPVYANMGSLIDGQSLDALAESYADRIAQLLAAGAMEDFDFIFGPAYKGIPLAAITCEALWRKHQINKRFLYDRKEAKAHGDLKADALIVGADQVAPGAKLLMIDDVITTGGAKFEAWGKISATLPGLKLVGVLVAVDRQESSGDALTSGPGAADEVKGKLGCPLYAIATMRELYAALAPGLPASTVRAWREYFAKWGTQQAQEWAK